MNGRLPLKHGSVWPQTLGKRVKDDPQHFIFQHRTNFAKQIFGRRKVGCRESSEMRVDKVRGRPELCLRGKRPFKVFENFEIRDIRRYRPLMYNRMRQKKLPVKYI